MGFEGWIRSARIGSITGLQELNKCRQQALGELPAAKSGLCQGKPHWHVCWRTLARATRSRNKSHPTAAIKIEETALAAQSNGRPRPSATLLQTPLQGPNFKEDFFTTRAASGSSGPSERPSALHTGLSSARNWKSSNNVQCTAAVCGLAQISLGTLGKIHRTRVATRNGATPLMPWTGQSNAVGPSMLSSPIWPHGKPDMPLTPKDTRPSAKVWHDVDSSAWSAAMRRPVDLPRPS